MPSAQSNCVIFLDLDGTLLNTFERHYTLYKDILTKLNVKNTALSSEDFWNKKKEGIPTAQLLSDNLTTHQKETFQSLWLEEIEKKEYLELDFLFKDSLHVLPYLKSKSQLVLTTLRHNKSNLRWQIKKVKIDTFFKDVLIGSPQKVHIKEHLARKYISKFHLRAEYIIGDTEVEIQTGKALGIETIALATGLRSKTFLESHKPDFLIDNLNQLKSIIT